VLGVQSVAVEIEVVRARYRGYIERQRRTAEQAARLEPVVLPDALWEGELVGLSREAREKLVSRRPGNAAQASRIAGVSPADVAVLLVHARRLAARDANVMREGSVAPAG
jgi:tRNA uridine 5-carboxymethylaminomethyl modification enzyme